MPKSVVYSSKAPAPIGPYNQAIKAGNLLFVSGQIALNGDTGVMVNTNIEAETQQVMKNLFFILTEAGADFQKVVKTTIFLKNMGDFAAVNGVYADYFENNSPARETVEVSRLPKDANVEISCIALLD
jgi:2-iminobutanoate/2-iminopropanoate deaminase